MNFSKVMSLISENNINPDEVLRLVDKVRRLDMKNENYRQVYMRRSNLEGGFGEYIIIEADNVEEALKDLEARKERLISMDTPYEEHTELAKGAIVGKNGNYVYLIARENPKEVEDELLSHLG